MGLKICLDTNAYSRLMSGSIAVKEILESADVIIIPAVMLGELYAGFEIGSQKKENRIVLMRFIAKSRAIIATITEETADCYGLLVKELRTKGRPIPTNDLWIAATALVSGAQLLNYDSHFSVITGLRVVNPE